MDTGVLYFARGSFSGSLAKSLMIWLDRTGLEEPVLGTEIDRSLLISACSQRCRKYNYLARMPCRANARNVQ